MAGQKITVNIASRPFNFTAASPEHESLIRFAAEQLDRKIKDMSARFPDMPMQDRLSVIALQECTTRLARESRLKSMEADKNSLLDEIQNYLKDIDESGR